MTFRSRSVSAFSCAIPFGETARNRPDVDLESNSVDTADVDRPVAPADFPDLPVLADELPDSADAAGGLVFGCRVAPTVVGNNAFRVVTRPAGRAAARVTEFSLALAFGETARNRPDADFESDSVAATDVDRPAAPVDFPNLPGLADELPDSADAAGGLVFDETARIRFDADFESDSVDATDADRHAAPVDFPDLPGFADALPDAACINC
jgi:hypothetical protein